jgi:glutaryl-CoA dehydrogenase
MSAPSELLATARSTAAAEGADPPELMSADLFGYEAMLTPDEWLVVQRTREFLSAHVAPVAQDCWARAEFPFQIIEPLAEVGIIGRAYGLDGSTPHSQLLTGFVGLEISRVDPSIATFVGVHSGLAMGTIALCASEEQQRRWLPAMQRMELIGAFGLTEPDGGSDVAGGMRTTAKRTGDQWVLNGAKRWIGNATFADLTIIWARDVDDDQVKGFVVEKDTPGFTATKIENKASLRTVQNADILLTDCRKARRIGCRTPTRSRTPPGCCGRPAAA